MDVLKRLITSSADPRKTSLAVKGFLLGIVPVIMLLTGIAGDELNTAIDGIEQVIFFVLSLVATGQMLWGLVRKWKIGRWNADTE